MLLYYFSKWLTALTKCAFRVVLSISSPPYSSQMFQKEDEALNSVLLDWKLIAVVP